MSLSYQGAEVSVEQLDPDLISVYGCPIFPTPTPTLDPDEGSSADPTPTPAPECSDGIDNDGDGLIDYSATGGGDRECRSPSDNDESTP